MKEGLNSKTYITTSRVLLSVLLHEEEGRGFDPQLQHTMLCYVSTLSLSVCVGPLGYPTIKNSIQVR